MVIGLDGRMSVLTKVDGTNPWFSVFEDAMVGMGHKIVPQVFPAATNSRFLRRLGITAFGFSPMRNSEVSISDLLGGRCRTLHFISSNLIVPLSSKIMLYENDEYLDKSIFIKGIEVYVNLMASQGLVTELDNGAHVVG